jgi:hypothetical protein
MSVALRRVSARAPELVRIRANMAPMSIFVVIATLPSLGSSLNGTV